MQTVIKRHRNLASVRDVDKLEHVVVVVPVGDRPKFPYHDILYRRARRQQRADDGVLITELPNGRGTQLTWARVEGEISAYELLTLARKLISPHFEGEAPKRLAMMAPGFSPVIAARVLEALTAATLARAPLPDYKRRNKSPTRSVLKVLSIYACPTKLDFSRTRAEAEGNHLARSLTCLPPNELTPGRYRERLEKLSETHGWAMTFLDLRTLRRIKAGAFLAVAQGSHSQDDGIVHLRYRPAGLNRRGPLALVGKGVCFDTGGHNLKTAKHMLGMHEDMAGSAVALGVLLALTRLKVNFPVDCWLALTQNLIGPAAYKQGDVVIALNGTSIEVVHTDAEGRMVLADTLTLAGRTKPVGIIDYATLTGTCVYALGTRYSGVFTNRRELLLRLMDAGVDSGERIWPFPVDRDYDKALDSDIADIKQCTLDGEADHILAARFLDRFVDASVPWIHIDLASANHKGGLAHIPTDVTGFGVRYTLNLVLDKQLLN